MEVRVKFDSSTQWTGWQATQKVEVPPGVCVERRVPLRAPTMHSDVGVPFLLSLGSGFFVFVVIAILLLAFDLKIVAAAALGGLAAAGIWFALVALWPRTLWATETITAPEPVPPPPTVVKTHYELPTGPNTVRIGEIDVDPELVIAWCQAACQNRSLAYTAWERKFALDDGTHGRQRYEAFRAYLVKEGFAEEAGGNVGLRVCWKDKDAVRFVKGFAVQSPAKTTPLLEPVCERVPAPGEVD